MIKAVVFDMDGTLVDTEKYLVEYWEKAGKLCGYPMTREDGLFLRSLAHIWSGISKRRSK